MSSEEETTPTASAALAGESLVAIETFIQATRDSGYKSTSSAMAEIIDNALDAGATKIWLTIAPSDDAEMPVKVAVLDNGHGMTARVMRQALRFGGSTRFNERADLGRYGMGLPNGSLSQSRRLDVYSWRGRKPLHTYLDVDEIAAGQLRVIPTPKKASLPDWFQGTPERAGTLIVWPRCDRLDNRRASTIARKLALFLGRVYRHYIFDGVEISINGKAVRPIDPLFLDERSLLSGAHAYGEPIQYEVAVLAKGKQQRSGIVTVRFAELPVEEWAGLSNVEKRRRGISKGAGVTVVRGKREIDYGWFFMGSKRKENYDDWWRCEVRFDPILDEVFGITHTKQQVRPRAELLEAIVPDMEATARALNARARRAHKIVQARTRFAAVESRASTRDHLLPPLPKIESSTEAQQALRRLAERSPALRGEATNGGQIQYTILEAAEAATSFYDCLRVEDRVVLSLNPEHPFHKSIYQVIGEQTPDAAKGMLDLLLLAAARAEAAAESEADRDAVRRFRLAWGRSLATFLKG